MKLFFLSILALCLSTEAFCTITADTNRLDSNGKKEGLWKERLESFDFYGDYIDGKKEGVWVAYYSNGIISNLFEYKNGMRNGISIGINQSGQYTNKENYKNDTIDGLTLSYNSGSLLHYKIN